MIVMIFDTHAHYDDESFDEDREELLAGLESAGIGAVVNVGACMKTSEASLKLADSYGNIYSAAGVHPSCIEGLTDSDMDRLSEMLKHPKMVAVGEIGLDYHFDDAPGKEEQIYWFRKQMDLALKEDMPVIIHSRDAAQDTFDIINESYELAKQQGKKLEGIIHCFSYEKEMAERYVKMGFYIGIGGVLTFKNARKLKEVAAAVPLERIVIETDCPYLAPEPFRGKRNCSEYLKYVVKELATIKNMSEEEIKKLTFDNALRIYRIDWNRRG